MKCILMLFSMLILKCCGIPKTVNIIDNDTSENKKLSGKYSISTLGDTDVSSFKLYIEFNEETKQVSGFSGCNRFFGAYQLDAKGLQFGAIGSTRMMCRGEGVKIEHQLNESFTKVNRLSFLDNTIQLYSNEDLLIVATHEIVDNSLVFEYSASSRGSYKSITINSSRISVNGKRESKSIEKELSKEVRSRLLALLEKVNLGSLSSLEPPSKAHQFDGAPLAQFKIIRDNKVYQVKPFDHGKPHPIIERLVKEILSISENIE